jgi:hypothetical protein
MSSTGLRLGVLVGWLLIGVSVVSVVQTFRESALWQQGNRSYSEQSPRERPFAFGGHSFTVVDDQATDAAHSETEYDGKIQPLIDGRALGPPSYARVRRGRDDLGRYHGWFDAWLFRDRIDGRQTLWLARRLQATATESPRFEVITVGEHQTPQRRVLGAWRLGGDYRLYRATQFVREGTWSTMPFALGDTIGIFPLALLVFPVGTFVLGIVLVRRGEETRRVAI